VKGVVGLESNWRGVPLVIQGMARLARYGRLGRMRHLGGLAKSQALYHLWNNAENVCATFATVSGLNDPPDLTGQGA
jgi:hypothetical protein